VDENRMFVVTSCNIKKNNNKGRESLLNNNNKTSFQNKIVKSTFYNENGSNFSSDPNLVQKRVQKMTNFAKIFTKNGRLTAAVFACCGLSASSSKF
jgi:hypothetical protein